MVEMRVNACYNSVQTHKESAKTQELLDQTRDDAVSIEKSNLVQLKTFNTEIAVIKKRLESAGISTSVNADLKLETMMLELNDYREKVKCNLCR